MISSALTLWDSNAIQNSNPASLSSKPSADATSPGSDPGTITSNDFLTLLVTEMKNQDPTATTDPNEYINQLVGVNSLQQLISINEILTADSNAVSGSGQAADAGNSARSAILQPSPAAQGNLSLPEQSAAAGRVASALSGFRKGL